MRFKSAHVVMQPYYITMLMMLVWPFLKEKLKKRVIYNSRVTMATA